jgi:hypothetical protein
MYEVFASVTNEHGTRIFPTGDGSINENVAENLMMRRMIQNPENDFFIEFVPSEDYFNAY